MATVTGLTAERMLAIEAASVVDGDVIANHLILTRHDGVQIDAGSVVGPAGPTGPAGASGFAVLTAAGVLEPGLSGQKRAGRVLTVADFTTLLGLSTPVGLFNLTALTNLGSGGALINKGVVTFGKGITGATPEAAQFVGNVAQALYIVDTGAADPFRIGGGSVGCWFRSPKAAQQLAICKSSASVGGFVFGVGGGGTCILQMSLNNTTWQTLVAGKVPVCDGRWHHIAFTYDGFVQCIYVDGVLDTAVPTTGGPITYVASPFNIGADGADAATNGVNPVFGTIDEAFVTTDVLNEDQLRLLYATKFAHGASFTPTGVALTVRRLRKGSPLAGANFPATPLRLHNFVAGSLADAGSSGTALTATGTPTKVAGPDGVADSAYNFLAANSQYLSSADTGLPAGTSARTIGFWFRSTDTAAKGLVGYGTAANGFQIRTVSTGVLDLWDGLTQTQGPFPVCDGQWHFVVVVADNAAADGMKVKMYVDGKLYFSNTVLNSTTLTGAGGFVVGKRTDTALYLTGQISRVFATATALNPEDIYTLYAVGSLSLGASPKNGGDHVERIDATNVYFIGDTLDSQNQIDLQVSA